MKDKKCKKKNLIACLLELILIKNIHSHIKKSTKKSLIDDLSKRLLELEFKSNHSIKSKCLKWLVKKLLPTIYGMKNTQSKRKPIKLRKKPGTTYCLGCKDYTNNFKPQEIKMSLGKNLTVSFVDLVNQDF